MRLSLSKGMMYCPSAARMPTFLAAPRPRLLWWLAKKGVFLYCLSNNDQNIFVNAKITESIEQNKILQMGVTVWINMDGKSRKIIGIRYPIGAEYSRPQSKQGEGQENALDQSPLAKANTIKLVGFKDVETNKFPSNNKDNIRGFIKYDNDGNLIYSLTIPKAKLPAGKNKDGSLILMNLAIEYGAPPSDLQSGKPAGYTPPPKINGERGKGGGGGGRGGSAGGGMPGGAGGGAIGGKTNIQEEPKPVTIWMKEIKLAEKK